VRVSRRSRRSFRGNDRTAPADRAYPEPQLEIPGGPRRRPMWVNGLRASRPRHAHLRTPMKRTRRWTSPPAWAHSRATSDRDAGRISKISTLCPLTRKPRSSFGRICGGGRRWSIKASMALCTRASSISASATVATPLCASQPYGPGCRP